MRNPEVRCRIRSTEKNEDNEEVQIKFKPLFPSLLSFGPRNPEGEVPLGCPATLLVPDPATAGRTYSQLAPSTHRKPLLRGAAGHFNRLLDPGAWGVASPLRLNVDFVVNTAFVVKTLQVRQQGRLRELHRLWCWPQRSSHGRDQLGYRSCTLTRGPAPKSTQPCFISQPFSSYVFLRKRRGEVLKKKISADIFEF